MAGCGDVAPSRRGAEGELLRRVDPWHRSLGQFFQDEIATPLGLELYTFPAPAASVIRSGTLGRQSISTHASKHMLARMRFFTPPKLSRVLVGRTMTPRLAASAHPVGRVRKNLGPPVFACEQAVFDDVVAQAGLGTTHK